MDPNQTVGWRETLQHPVSAAAETFSEVSRQTQHALGNLGDAVAPVRRSVEQAIVTRPIQAVVLSFAAGVLLGWLIKRS